MLKEVLENTGRRMQLLVRKLVILSILIMAKVPIYTHTLVL